ncbi:MAG: MliC family protein [Candidatus Andersenbacteria bacterium]|nr:MliC family protein [Candidatus Andersenbacteria bacterium]
MKNSLTYAAAALIIIAGIALAVWYGANYTKPAVVPTATPIASSSPTPAGTAKTVTFACDAGKTVQATFYLDNDTRVDLKLSDGRAMSLPHAMSASGARYANADESIVFWNKGDTAFITEGDATTFANCALPGTVDRTTWKTITDTAQHTSFQYPPTIPTKYISLVDWPPKIQVTHEPFACTQAGSEIARGGKTEQKTINGTTYCLTTSSEGAAGSMYNQYAYAWYKGDTTVILTFSLRLVQCANYDQPKQQECQAERDVFTPDTVLDQIAQTVTF